MSEYDTDIVCRILQVSKSGYYSHKIQSDCEITEIEKAVINCFKKHNRNYGRIRIRKELLNTGTNISEYRIARILKKYGLVAKSGRTGKPKADNIKMIIERHNLKAPFYVGDTKMDFDAASKNNIPFIFAAYGFGSCDEYTAKIDTPSDLLKICENL